MTVKGQVTIPVEIRRRFGIGPHDTFAFVVTDDEIRLMPATSVVARTAGMLSSDQPRLSPEEEDQLVEHSWAEEIEG
jgi:AbrB family looped-hinge helix DNA binding protein